MARDIKKQQAWVVSWSCSDSDRSVLTATTQGEAIAVFPGRVSKSTIEGALIALHQVLTGSDAEAMAGRLKRTSLADSVEWDYPSQNAKIGVGLEVWAQHAEITYDRSTKALEETRGSGRVTFIPSAKWQTRSEYREQLKVDMQSRGLL